MTNSINSRQFYQNETILGLDQNLGQHLGQHLGSATVKITRKKKRILEKLICAVCIVIVAVFDTAKKRNFAITGMALFVTAVFAFAITSLNVVTISDNGSQKLVYTMKQDPGDILKSANVLLASGDEVTVKNYADSNELQINILRCFPVTIQVDGQIKTLMTTGGTVEDVLKLANVYVKSADIVSPALSQSVEQDAPIVITRVEYREFTLDSAIPFETHRTFSDKIPKGIVQISQEGENGILKSVYRETLVDGKHNSQKLMHQYTEKAPIDKIEIEGTYAVSTASSPKDLLLDENGNPVNYRRVLTNQSTTAYSARPGAKTASGMLAKVGHVAVNPKVIPYGTKLYIKSSDGSFVYGYAVAADTGTALLDGRADIDLYFNTNAECIKFGRKNLDVYILD